MRLIDGVLMAILLSGCASSDQASLPLTFEEARQIVLAQRSMVWKDPESIREAKIGQPYSCPGGLVHLANIPNACVCVEANAKNSFGGYEGLKQSAVLISGRTIVDTMPPRMMIDRCDGMVAFPELNGVQTTRKR